MIVRCMVNNWSYCSGQGLRAWPGSSARISNANTPTMKNTNGRDHVHRAQPLRVRRAQVTQEPVTARKVNPPGESGDSTLIETMLPHRYSNRYRRFAPISRVAYLRSIHTGAGC